jgi:secondary thiamine-phosphate synthase enzyme
MRRFTMEFDTEGNTDVINISPELSRRLAGTKGMGVLHLFVGGSTAALTTMEYEPGLVRHDLKAAMQKLIPDDAHYEHEATWNDDNGHSHVRATLMGPSLTLPFEDGILLTGEYQQVILVDFDTSPRRRQVIVTVIG